MSVFDEAADRAVPEARSGEVGMKAARGRHVQTAARWIVEGLAGAGVAARSVGVLARDCVGLPSRLKLLLVSAQKVSYLLQVSWGPDGPDLSLAGS
jgi:hypothetical protein